MVHKTFLLLNSLSPSMQNFLRSTEQVRDFVQVSVTVTGGDISHAPLNIANGLLYLFYGIAERFLLPDKFPVICLVHVPIPLALTLSWTLPSEDHYTYQREASPGTYRGH